MKLYIIKVEYYPTKKPRGLVDRARLALSRFCISEIYLEPATSNREALDRFKARTKANKNALKAEVWGAIEKNGQSARMLRCFMDRLDRLKLGFYYKDFSTSTAVTSFLGR